MGHPIADARWDVQVSTDAQPYVTVLTTPSAGLALVTYGLHHVENGGRKRVLRNGKVMSRQITKRETAPVRVPEPEPTGALF